MLKRLMRDHQHITILLNILTNKNARLAEGEAVNFNLIRDIVEYMQGYAEHSHHPVEDITYHYYAQKMSIPNSDQLSDEHDKLAQVSGSLMYSLNMVLSDVVISRDKLINDLANYIHLQVGHMQFEETEIFPHLAKTLDSSDWQNIELLCQNKLVDDPLFSQDDNIIFEELRQYIVKAENKINI
ncbi:hemerythrin domain-containing protein [Shewanella sp. OMA3-2]|uniref:hemerythrin domain-containing protein n=1 Tax=Shewanella sp. OMA3-2 TaxID=2908650 RepID=UPI001F213AA1|nr:hemerythrin domain-containing protein [Shewanella sp. OMA3-2]UJF23489.1 hemerythrin domain-containing protein [Shewanella sp. OMA3-2]